MAFTDRMLACVQCGQQFTFSASEQETFAARGYTNEPKRCPSCRESRRMERYGGSSSYGGARGGGGGGYQRDRTMYTVTCASCGKEAEVPFQPRGDRPVYCNDCFQRTRSSRY